MICFCCLWEQSLAETNIPYIHATQGAEQHTDCLWRRRYVGFSPTLITPCIWSVHGAIRSSIWLIIAKYSRALCVVRNTHLLASQKACDFLLDAATCAMMQLPVRTWQLITSASSQMRFRKMQKKNTISTTYSITTVQCTHCDSRGASTALMQLSISGRVMV
jgi:hypothetical protein